MMRRLWVLGLLPALTLAACGGPPTAMADALRQARIKARAAAAAIAPPRPVLVLTPTRAHLYRDADRHQQASLVVPHAKMIEAIALTPRYVWWQLAPVTQLRAERAAKLASDARNLAALQARLGDLPDPYQGRAIALLTQTRAFMDAQSRRGTVDRAALGEFVRRHRVLSDRLLQDAAELRLTRLHTVVEGWWAGLEPTERATARAAVIDAAAHREGHPQVQYLMQALGAAGEGQRIVYREGGTVAQALDAVADLAQGVALGIEGYGDPLHLRQAPTAPGAHEVLKVRDVRLK